MMAGGWQEENKRNKFHLISDVDQKVTQLTGISRYFPWLRMAALCPKSGLKTGKICHQFVTDRGLQPKI
jgi:hypothetical protein